MALTDEQRRKFDAISYYQLKADMEQTGGMRLVGGTLANREAAREYLAEKQHEQDELQKNRDTEAAKSNEDGRFNLWIGIFGFFIAVASLALAFSTLR